MGAIDRGWGLVHPWIVIVIIIIIIISSSSTPPPPTQVAILAFAWKCECKKPMQFDREEFVRGMSAMGCVASVRDACPQGCASFICGSEMSAGVCSP